MRWLDGITDVMDVSLSVRNLYTGQEETVRTRHGTTDWFQTGKGVCQGCILSPCLFNFYLRARATSQLSFSTPDSPVRY